MGSFNHHVQLPPRASRLMAPMYRIPAKSRQIEIILPPRPANGLPAQVEPVSKRISGKVFFSLLAGTVCIFFISVLCWKTGRFFRAFSRDKVLKGGKPATVQYAKTWHGWTELTKHEERREKRKNWLKRFRKCLSWKSTHADYRWVYWDPGNSEINQHYEDQKGIRWLPQWLLSYDFHNAYAPQANVYPSGHCSISSKRNEASQGKQKETYASGGKPPVLISSERKVSGGLDRGFDVSTLRRRRPSSRMRPPFDPTTTAEERTISHEKQGPSPLEPPRHTHIMPEGTSDFQVGVLHSSSVMLSPRNRSSSMPSFSSASHDQSFVTSFSRQLSIAENPHADQKVGNLGTAFPNLISTAPKTSPFDGNQSILITNETTTPRGKGLSWRYKAWGARMQLDTFDRTRPFHGYEGRPGSPTSDILMKDFSSGRVTNTSESFSATRYANIRTSASNSTGQFGSSALVEADNTANFRLISPLMFSETSPAGFHASRKPVKGGHCPYDGSALHVPAGPSSPRRRGPGSFSSEILEPTQEIAKKSPPSDSGTQLFRRQLSNPEVRLLYNLSRRLEWLSNELDPGRKPFHFPMLANHWLNRKTWFVLDPASRTPETSKRLHGDPRVIRSMAGPPVPVKKVKYPNVSRPKAHMPRIDSWRFSVNRARKSSGMREFVRSIELFDGSAEEPPQNAIDTSSWILRKPPQGFEMSTRQKTAYYNSGTGWHETLTDWQKVRTAYRVRKLVHEGRVNRTRVKEIALGIGGVCQMAARRFTPEWDIFQFAHQRKLERRERSGYGWIPTRRGQRSVFQRSRLPESNDPAAAMSGDITAIQLPTSTAVATTTDMECAEIVPELVMSESEEQRDTG